MTVVEDIQDRIEELLADQNGYVVLNAIFKANPTCASCNYPANHEKFEYLLRSYEEVKRCEHRAYKQRDLDVIGQKYIQYQIMADGMREALNRIWPCQDCMRIYNPTGKWNKSGSKNNLKTFVRIDDGNNSKTTSECEGSC